MGTFASSIQIYVGDKSAPEILSQLLKWIRKSTLSQGYKEISPDEKTDIDRLVTVGPLDKGPWISVYDEGRSMSETAESISKKLKATIIMVSLNDSDVLQLYLYKNGTQVDQYDSCPEYSLEKPTKAQRALVKGNLNQWKELLLPGTEVGQLRKAWDSKPLFADDILVATAQFLGMDVNLAFGSPEIESYEGITRLAFQLEETPDFRIKAEGPPRFQLHSYGDHLFVSEGDHVDIQMSVYNRGGAADGLLVVAMGEAIEQGFIEVESVRVLTHKNEGFETTDAQFEVTPVLVDGKQVMIRAASLPDLELPQGVVGGMDRYWSSNWRQAFEANQKTSISAYIKCKALKPGQSKVTAGLAPTTNSTGQAMLRVAFDIASRSRLPLRYRGTGPSHYLRSLEHPRWLVGLISLGADRATCARVAADTIEKWHSVITLLENQYYEITIFPQMALRPETKKIKAGKFLSSKQWAHCRATLATCAILTSSLSPIMVVTHGIPNSLGSGFAFGTGIHFAYPDGAALSPQLALWVDSQAPDVSVGAIERTLTEIIDEVMIKAAGYQAFMARWNWIPHVNINTTPYESACGINGQCTTSREWCSRFLRGASGNIWLGSPLLAHLANRPSLEAVASLRPVGNGLHVSLKPGADLTQMELALQTLLPSDQDWHNTMEQLHKRAKPAD